MFQGPSRSERYPDRRDSERPPRSREWDLPGRGVYLQVKADRGARPQALGRERGVHAHRLAGCCSSRPGRHRLVRPLGHRGRGAWLTPVTARWSIGECASRLYDESVVLAVGRAVEPRVSVNVHVSTAAFGCHHRDAEAFIASRDGGPLLIPTPPPAQQTRPKTATPAKQRPRSLGRRPDRVLRWEVAVELVQRLLIPNDRIDEILTGQPRQSSRARHRLGVLFTAAHSICELPGAGKWIGSHENLPSSCTMPSRGVADRYVAAVAAGFL